MIIQNSTAASQAMPPVRRVLEDKAKVISEPQNEKSVQLTSDTSLKNAENVVATQKKAPSEELKNAVSDINKAMRESKQNLEFSIDSDTKMPMVKLVDSDTGVLIRQIPSEETLAIARSIDRYQQGLLLRQQA